MFSVFLFFVFFVFVFDVVTYFFVALYDFSNSVNILYFLGLPWPWTRDITS